MKKKTNAFKVIAVVVGIALALFLLLFILGLPWTLMYLHMDLRPDPPMPEITYAEFPFTLVYKLNEKEIVYEDVVICEYGGIANDMGHDEKYRTWNKRYKSGKEAVVLLELEDGKHIMYALRFTAEYLMGDKESDKYQWYNNAAFLEVPYEIVGRTAYESYPLTDEQLLNDYNIEIISFEIAPPIENSFIPVE